MKKTILLFFTFFSVVTISMAQVSLVPKAGITIANLAFDDDFDSQKSLIGFTGGLGFNFALTPDEFLSLQPEVLYVQKGAAAEPAGVDFKYTLNYLEVPVLVKIGFGSDVVKAYVNLGPSVSYLLNSKLKGDNFSFAQEGDDEKRLDFGANFGGGIGFALGAASSIFLDARYNAGLADVFDGQKSKNQVFYLTAGFKVPLSR
ncbi:MAG TPA: porin family protein [Cytophagales bacterium]|nr:porin family protein [Cytophagales bacterium]